MISNVTDLIVELKLEANLSVGDGHCARCSEQKPLNEYALCKKCFLGWFDGLGVHCVSCLWVSPRAPLEIMEAQFSAHLSQAHPGVVMQFSHKLGGARTKL